MPEHRDIGVTQAADAPEASLHFREKSDMKNIYI